MSPPPLIPLAQFGGDWPRYLRALYQIYVDTVVHAGLTFLGCPVRTRFRPSTEGMGYGFLHLISSAPSSKNRNEEARCKDLGRCERLRWISWCIVNADQEGFSYWENFRGTETHVVIWAEPYDYVVVLAKRVPYENSAFYLLKTAYPLLGHRKTQLRRERDAWHAAQKG